MVRITAEKGFVAQKALETVLRTIMAEKKQIAVMFLEPLKVSFSRVSVAETAISPASMTAGSSWETEARAGRESNRDGPSCGVPTLQGRSSDVA